MMKKSLMAMAFGTFGLGIAEFAMMGILGSIAQDLQISITQAGHLISAYALGVCVGSPALLLVRKFPLKRILLLLSVVILAGNLCAAAAPNFTMLLIARFLSGFPHGAYFGVASIIAQRLAPEGKATQAVSIMMAGMTVATVFGVPLGTALSNAISWRLTFVLVSCWSIISLYGIWRWVPRMDALPDTGFKGQFRFMKSPAPWLIVSGTLIGGGGHRSGKEKSNWDLLRDIAKEYFPEAKERYFWATQDCMSLDKRPYIGPYSKNTPDLFVATGFGKWGMTGSMLSAMILSDLVQEKNNEYSTVFSPSRNMLKPQLISNLGHALVGIGRIGGKRCSHMGCVLQWNKEEQTWECPCHGSRFSADGKVLDNPACDGLKKKHKK